MSFILEMACTNTIRPLWGHSRPITYCYLTGWHTSKLVEAAYLVPESLDSDEVSYIFGVEELLLSDPRNGKKHLSRKHYCQNINSSIGVTSHENIKCGLDVGIINHSRTAWQFRVEMAVCAGGRQLQGLHLL